MFKTTFGREACLLKRLRWKWNSNPLHKQPESPYYINQVVAYAHSEGKEYSDLTKEELKPFRVKDYRRILKGKYIRTDRCSFELFMFYIRQRLANMGDKKFVKIVITKKEIMQLYDMKWYPEAFYLLAMVDYLSKLHNIQIDSGYDQIRSQKLDTVIYPSGVLMSCEFFGTDELKRKAEFDSIPEFMKYNIVETDIRRIV